MRQQATRIRPCYTGICVTRPCGERRLNGMVSELVYRNNDIVLTHILLPLLRQLAGSPAGCYGSLGAKLNRTGYRRISCG